MNARRLCSWNSRCPCFRRPTLYQFHCTKRQQTICYYYNCEYNLNKLKYVLRGNREDIGPPQALALGANENAGLVMTGSSDGLRRDSVGSTMVALWDACAGRTVCRHSPYHWAGVFLGVGSFAPLGHRYLLAVWQQYPKRELVQQKSSCSEEWP